MSGTGGENHENDEITFIKPTNVNYSEATSLAESKTDFNPALTNLTSPTSTRRTLDDENDENDRPIGLDSPKTNERYIMREDDEDLKPARGCWAQTKMFISYAYGDIKRNKLHFSLAFGSVWIVVLSICLVNTIVTMGPLIFLGMG